MSFLALPNGRLINADAIKSFDPNRSNRLDYLDGAHELLTQPDADAVREALAPPTKTRKPKQ